MKKNIQEYSDCELFDFLNQNSYLREAAFKELFNRYAKRIYSFCRKILANDRLAEDITQDTFLSLLKFCKESNQITNFPAFIFRIARNLCINQKKHIIKYEEFLEDETLVYNEFSQNNEELAKLIESALELLPEAHREAFCLQMYGGMSYTEIAEVHNVPVSTVRNWVVRAKVKLRKILMPYFEEIG
jgi:RNA polymerase sigma-70 factor, ECF subfamily